MPLKRFLDSSPTSITLLHNTITPTFTLKATMVWVSNYASASIAVSVTNNGGSGDASDFTISSKGNETYILNHFYRTGEETIRITRSGKNAFTFKVQKNDCVLVWDDAYGVEGGVIITNA
ncbi:hypothetical protein C8F04DRAFT_1268059 [Mycena alexandri]|uniref:Uncharacterized protein n=1 Tax=Mycena alexandri TaxID=1745969 RepID=A0AAD6SEC6_9AGAR|nr:hypothetical protein C8F04DRAFT_1268059 [Mycena alexandri]